MDGVVLHSAIGDITILHYCLQTVKNLKHDQQSLTDWVISKWLLLPKHKQIRLTAEGEAARVVVREAKLAKATQPTQTTKEKKNGKAQPTQTTKEKKKGKAQPTQTTKEKKNGKAQPMQTTQPKDNPVSVQPPLCSTTDPMQRFSINLSSIFGSPKLSMGRMNAGQDC
jgi:hypothetical protein